MKIIDDLIIDIEKTKGLSTCLDRNYCIKILNKANKKIDKQLNLSGVVKSFHCTERNKNNECDKQCPNCRGYEKYVLNK